MPAVPILSKKFTNNTNNSVEKKVDASKDKLDDSNKDIAKATINTEAAVKDDKPSSYNVSNGFTNKSNSTNSTSKDKLDDSNKDIAKATINTEAAVKDDKPSSYNVSNGFTNKSNSTNSSNGNTNSGNVNSSSSNNNNQVNKVDKSSLLGKDAVLLEGDTFEPIKDLKLRATDKNGSDISDKIEITHNPVNTTKPGSYSVTANVKLNDGYIKQRSFKVDVKATDLNVAVKSFKPVKEVVQKGDSVVLDLF